MQFSYYTQMLDQSIQVPLYIGTGTERRVFARKIGQADLSSLMGQSTPILFVYTVQASDVDSDGIVIDRTALFGDEGNIVFANLNDACVPASTDLQFVAEPTASHAVNGSMVHGCKHIFCTTGDFHFSSSNRTGHFADVQGMADTYFRYGTEEYLIQALYLEELSGGNYSVYMAWDRELLPS